MGTYRTINDGEVEWLQYLFHYKWLWFKRQKWLLVRSDRWEYFDEQWELHNNRYGNQHSNWEMKFRYINSEKDNIPAFVLRWPNVNDWYKHRNLIVAQMKRSYSERHIKQQEEIKKSKGQIKYL